MKSLESVRWKLHLEYDGTQFSGWQRQPNARTVQEEVEKAIAKIWQSPITIVAAGRTDAGVHALDQTIHFDAIPKIEPPQLQKALNALLPNDISAHHAEIARPDFHARFSARSRLYHFYVRRSYSATRRLYSIRHRFPFEAKRVHEKAQIFLGKHDFRLFSHENKELNHHICEIFHIAFESINDDEFRFSIRANRFLHNMVRILLGTLLFSEKNNLDEKYLKKLLNEGPKNEIGPTLPPHGLFLAKIFYR